MKYIPFFGVIVLLIAMLSCRMFSSRKVRHSDFFYNDTGEGKFLVVPLIKPYRVVTDEGAGIGWQINGSGQVPSFRQVEKVAVGEGIIMLFSSANLRVMVYPSDSIWHWGIIVPEQKVEIGFDNEEDFLNYIQAYGVEKPNWVDPMESFKQFESTGCLEWIPDCE